MTTIVDIETAAATLDELIGRVLAGEDVLIARDGHPVARLMPFSDALPSD